MTAERKFMPFQGGLIRRGPTVDVERIMREPMDVPPSYGITNEQLAAALRVPVEVMRRAPPPLILSAGAELAVSGTVQADIIGAFRLEWERQLRVEAWASGRIIT